MNIQEAAKILDEAAMNAEPVEQLSLDTQFTIDEAYEIQRLSIERRLSRGEKFVGLKLGFTSFAKMEQMGVHDMIWGRLTDSMLHFADAELDFNKFIHPRAEPELCFLVKKDIDREIGLDEVEDYIEAVAPATEIIDSRYKNFKFSLEDVVADNCSSTAFVVGAWQNINQDLSDLHMELKINGEVKEEGSSKAILGNPWLSVTNASRLAVAAGQVFPAGSYLMAGAATSAVFLEKGQRILTRVEQIGSVGFDIK
ncbi:4-oxalocrotonate decarboxylase [bacterium]|nr:4-oxalocrotonate decarboxylase [bacterium]